jgi:Ca-activated chloride channel homolog
VRLQADIDGLDLDPAVAEPLALLQANRERRLAIAELDRGDLQAALESLKAIDQRLAGLPQSEAVERERHLLSAKKTLLSKDQNLGRKRLRNESLRSSLNVWESGDDNT